MPNTTGFDFGDVLLVPFPFTDHTTTKKRPAVVVSSVAYNRERPDVIVMAVTSQPRRNVFGDVSIQRWKEAGLLKPSVIKAVVATIEKRLVLNKLGRLDDRDARALGKAILTVLGA
ncbi:MAG: type II toxin-antitoxin system PemK/MazF family toxin [Vicinamibacterales bacterium]